jgi:hypothetical protein
VRWVVHVRWAIPPITLSIQLHEVSWKRSRWLDEHTEHANL